MVPLRSTFSPPGVTSASHWGVTRVRPSRGLGAPRTYGRNAINRYDRVKRRVAYLGGEGQRDESREKLHGDELGIVN